MVLFINCSPKFKNSNSARFINSINKKIKDNFNICDIYSDNNTDVINLIKKSEKIIIAFPLYVDAPPSKLIFLLENLKNEKLDNKEIYCIVNCGFLEPEQNNVACEIIKCFCIQKNIYYKGAFKIGCGEIVGKYLQNRILNHFYMKKELQFINAINNSNYIEITFTINLISKRLFCILGNISWRLK